MDGLGQRRPVARYGKNKGRTAGINFFTTETKPSSATASTSFAPAIEKYASASSSPDRLGIATLKSASRAWEPQSPMSNVTSPIGAPSKSTTSRSQATSESPVRSSPQLPVVDQITFEILSSGDEREIESQRPQKKRKLVQSLKQVKPRPVQATITPKTGPDISVLKRQALTKKQQNLQMEPGDLVTGKTQQKQESSVRSEAPISPANFVDLTIPSPTHITATRVNSAGPVSKTRLEKVPKVKKQDVAIQEQLPQVKHIPEKTGVPRADNSSKTMSKTRLNRVVAASRTDQTNATLMNVNGDGDIAMEDDRSPPRLKKRTQIKTKIADAETPSGPRYASPTLSQTSAASPGSRLFSELRLSPGQSPRAELILDPTTSPSPSPPPSPVRRGRLRRVDLLDAPSDPSSKPTTKLPSLHPSTRSAHSSQISGSDKDKLETLSTRPALDRSSSSQTRQGYGKARTTYGRERSHLADMVIDDLDALSYGSSQEASQQLLSQLASSSGPSQLQMELDLDSGSSDDGLVALKLKSIHELRQAGSNDRAGRDLEGLLTDIDPTAKDAVRGLRIQAFINLFTKLSQDSFAIFVLDQGLDRLVLWSRHLDDKISKFLLNMIFWRLLYTNSVPPVKSRLILQAVAANTSLITDLGTLGHLARDRKENLTKQMIHDLEKFETLVLAQNMLPTYEGDKIVPAAITLAALHDSLQKMVAAGTLTVNMGTQSQRKIVSILTQVSQATDNRKLEDRFITKVALSLLKLFSGPLDDDLSLTDPEYVKLGDTLAVITRRAVNDNYEDLLQAVLHFAISLCNDRPKICRKIGHSSLGTSIIALTDERFSRLLQTADIGNAIDTFMLDSLILSLASLLTITEYDDTVRLRFAHQTGDRPATTNLDQIVTIYTRVAPQVEGATTTEKIQLQVAFGYLSLLICNLCLHDDLWKQTQNLLANADKSISDVVASAKELLIHLQTVEMSQKPQDAALDDTTMALDGLTLRFSTILAAVKVA